ncbi:MAG: hypothetical protein Fur0037_03770 [Planctomycetota bacterium]
MVQVPLPGHPVPLFPLPGTFLFPGQVQALRIFEPRYVAMVQDLLDGPGRFVLATLRRPTAESREPVLPVAGYGEIVRHDRNPDGTYNLWLLGLGRVRIEEVASDRPYRLAVLRPFEEIPAPGSIAAVLSEQLRKATAERVHHDLSIPEGTPPGLLADLLVQMVKAPPGVTEELFVESSIAERARKALVAHERYPPEGEQALE